MDITLYSLLVYAHVICFVYWLGGDLGVYFSANYVANRNLALDERLRFLHLLAIVDMGPRTALILILPLGFQMSAMLGVIELPQSLLFAIWGASLAWLFLAWTLFFNERNPAMEVWKKVDAYIRMAVIITMAGLGVASLVSEGPFLTDWLALKAALYGIVVSLGLYLRTVIKDWQKGFGMVRAGGADADAGNDLIEQASGKSKIAALTLWALVAIIAFLGNVKPF